jgi:hypothetical protein
VDVDSIVAAVGKEETITGEKILENIPTVRIILKKNA